MDRFVRQQNRPFWLITVSLFIAVIVTNLVAQGLGGDGVVYAAISWNLAHGIGSFWNPYYLQPFYDHPPLAFYLESCLFKLLGNHFWIEKLYSALTAIVSIFAIVKIWRLSVRTTHNLPVSWHYAWIPCLFWMMVGDNLDAYQNNLLENTLLCFTTWAAFVLLKNLLEKRTYFISLLSLVGSALLLTAAIITKGPQCVFIIVSILLYWLIFRGITFLRALGFTGVLIGLIVLFMVLILSYEPAYQNLHNYWLDQFWASLSGSRNGPYKGWQHLYVLWLLFQYLLPFLILIPLFIFIKAIQQRTAFTLLIVRSLKNKWFIFYLVLGCSASLPVAFSSRLQEPYILQSFPFFILAATQILTPIIIDWVQSLKVLSRFYRYFSFSSFVLLGVILVNLVFNYGKVTSHGSLNDILMIGHIVPRNSIVSVTPSVIINEDIVQAYFYRYWQIQLTTREQCDYYVTVSTDPVPAGYKSVPIVLQHLRLYQNPTKECGLFIPAPPFRAGK